MTEWIDTFVAKLNPDTRAANENRAEQKRISAHIEEQAPGFIGEATAVAQALAEELDTRLGATLGEVTFSESTGGFTVKTVGGPASVTVKVKLNVTERVIEVDVNWHKPNSAQSDGALTERYMVQPTEFGIELRLKDGSSTSEAISDPKEFASAILEKWITRILLG